MTRLPEDPSDFTQHVARYLRKHLPTHPVEIVGPLELRIDGEPWDLTNLYRVCKHSAEDPALILEEFTDDLLTAQQVQQIPLPLDVVGGKIMPRITPLDFFTHRRADLIAHQPYINDTVILYVIDINGIATPVTTEQLVRWDIDEDRLDAMARGNLATAVPELEVQIYRAEQGPAALLSAGDGYDASRLLLEGLHEKLAPELGRDFLVAIPSRDVFLAFPLGPDGFVDRLRRQVEADFQQLPYPITSRLFLMTRDGVADWLDAA